MKKCHFCAEEIQDAAIVCKHCSRALTPPKETAANRRVGALTITIVGFVGLAVIRSFLQQFGIGRRQSIINPQHFARASNS
jgi:hypothetical protein